MQKFFPVLVLRAVVALAGRQQMGAKEQVVGFLGADTGAFISRSP